MVWKKWMRRAIGLASPMVLGSCAGDRAPPPPAVPPAPAPFYVQGGAGSEHGNFVSVPEIETTGPGGVRCIIYVWDRPLTAQTALRLRSQSCQDPRNPNFYIATELERIVIPMTSSTLFSE
jgi:hypothetical protein